MSAGAGGSDGHEMLAGRRSAAAGWAVSDVPAPACGVAHSGAPGTLDESARRLSHPELAVATLLQREGHHVVSQAEGRGPGKVADLRVCGLPVEVKALRTLGERPGGMPASPRTVYNRLVSSSGQAGVTVVWAAGSGLRASDAAAGLHAFARSGRAGQVRAVRIVGDGFDLGWQARAGVDVARAAARPVHAPSRRLGAGSRAAGLEPP